MEKKSFDELKIMVDAQEWLDIEYPIDYKLLEEFSKENKVKKRSEVKLLDISQKNLKGVLKLVGFDNLVELDCSNNQLTELDISDSPKLKVLVCNDNDLKDIIFPLLGQDELMLKRINVSNNIKLDTIGIEKRFLKVLPSLIERRVEAVDEEKFKKIIEKKTGFLGEVKFIDFFSTW